VRIYEHDPALCQREIDLLRSLADSVPVPLVIYAEAAGWEGLPPYLLMELVRATIDDRDPVIP